MGGGCRRWAQLSVHRHCQWLWFPSLRFVTVDVAKDWGGLGGVVSTSFKKYLSTVRSSGSSSAQNCIKMIKTKKICGFVKPEVLLLLKRSSRGEEGKTRMGRFTSKCSQFSHRVCCALNFFFI